MTPLNWLMQEDAIFIASDTLAIRADSHTPSVFQTKIHPLLHMDGVVCGTGIDQFIAEWYIRLQTGMLALSIPQLDHYVTPALKSLAADMSIPVEKTTTIYHFGYDSEQHHFRAYAYRSGNDFASEELPYGFGMKPVVDFERTGRMPDDFVALIALQRDHDRIKPISDRIGIGGEVHFLVMTPGDFRFSRIHRFEDYDDLYSQMCAQLPPTKS